MTTLIQLFSEGQPWSGLAVFIAACIALAKLLDKYLPEPVINGLAAACTRLARRMRAYRFSLVPAQAASTCSKALAVMRARHFSYFGWRIPIPVWLVISFGASCLFWTGGSFIQHGEFVMPTLVIFLANFATDALTLWITLRIVTRLQALAPQSGWATWPKAMGLLAFDLTAAALLAWAGFALTIYADGHAHELNPFTTGSKLAVAEGEAPLSIETPVFVRPSPETWQAVGVTGRYGIAYEVQSVRGDFGILDAAIASARGLRALLPSDSGAWHFSMDVPIEMTLRGGHTRALQGRLEVGPPEVLIALTTLIPTSLFAGALLLILLARGLTFFLIHWARLGLERAPERRDGNDPRPLQAITVYGLVLTTAIVALIELI